MLQGWVLYQGLGGDEEQLRKLRWRVAEMQSALRVLRALASGVRPPRPSCLLPI